MTFSLSKHSVGWLKWLNAVLLSAILQSSQFLFAMHYSLEGVTGTIDKPFMLWALQKKVMCVVRGSIVFSLTISLVVSRCGCFLWSLHQSISPHLVGLRVHTVKTQWHHLNCKISCWQNFGAIIILWVLLWVFFYPSVLLH